ncbi:hypothetical protein F0562_035272 [Nyssa sinensis]|uniref:NADH dehydrogenase [ubiquinone] 1 alpha subcomplex subunit 13 n=1 Tax=Nyssa sinensis TaxID=561372 RepID=A0A5J5AC39_9ASTE|nr:hypothetical protein F0562_035272 [Nyssa sinensis]
MGSTHFNKDTRLVLVGSIISLRKGARPSLERTISNFQTPFERLRAAGTVRKNRTEKKMTEAVIRNKPGMASVKDMPFLQDGPPPGGFAPVRFARRIPNKGPSAVAIFLTTVGVFSWGMYQVGQGNKIRRAIKEEKYAARRAILPLLQAEEDERFVKEWKNYLEEEAKIMKDVPGWKVGESVYHSGRWMPPATGELRPDVW